jgi:hypothetical protein
MRTWALDCVYEEAALYSVLADYVAEEAVADACNEVEERVVVLLSYAEERRFDVLAEELPLSEGALENGGGPLRKTEVCQQELVVPSPIFINLQPILWSGEYVVALDELEAVHYQP